VSAGRGAAVSAAHGEGEGAFKGRVMKINVMGDKGGVGKSVTAVHLGAVLGLRFGLGAGARRGG
jgi:Mrp family chromosome partitioning ATPase